SPGSTCDESSAASDGDKRQLKNKGEIMKKYEIEFAIVIVLLSIVVAIQARLTEPCRQKQPMQIDVYDRGQYK
ncbi:hypothetical protein ACTHUR_11260, partial [Neisseria sp. P0021.S007]|uniref:hypothetical protein n=1 Tax=Neisseria sp. P0021.S007 TaxID=3436822 RepID=UPI003F809414